MKSIENSDYAAFFAGVAIWIACAGGWIANIVKLWNYDGSGFTGEVILRVLGIFIAPLGVVLGYL